MYADDTVIIAHEKDRHAVAAKLTSAMDLRLALKAFRHQVSFMLNNKYDLVLHQSCLHIDFETWVSHLFFGGKGEIFCVFCILFLM